MLIRGKKVRFTVEEVLQFYSGSIYVVPALQKSSNKSAMLWNVSLLLTEDHLTLCYTKYKQNQKHKFHDRGEELWRAVS